MCPSASHSAWYTVGPQDYVSNGRELRQREIQTHGRARVEMTLAESDKSQPCPMVLQEIPHTSHLDRYRPVGLTERSAALK